jgi:alkanesulfonate monooxygenase SsuD/methylene tetrahydromethanopterin reductase-like flavin-dependent oxidoreductase (luciferase family)
MTEDVKKSRVRYLIDNKEPGMRSMTKEEGHMQFGVTLPDYVGPRLLAEIAHEAEESGWDGIFVWDTIFGNDPWVMLAAVAMRTERIRMGTMLTPLSRRRPWKLAGEAVALDHLSNGRVILPVGLGAPETGFHKVGEELDRKVRAKMMDESLDILDGLWSGQPFSYRGEHFHVEDVTFDVTPLQHPRIPIWVVGAWPRIKSMRRALRCDGILPVTMNEKGAFGEVTPDTIRAVKAYIDEQRAMATPFDIVMEGETPGDDAEKATSIVQPLADAGMTWWLEAVWGTPETNGGVDGMRTRIKQGPPRIQSH